MSEPTLPRLHPDDRAMIARGFAALFQAIQGVPKGWDRKTDLDALTAIFISGRILPDPPTSQEQPEGPPA